MGSDFSDLHPFEKKMLHICANSIWLSVYRGDRDFVPSFPQSFQQNC